jgi:hypothetical protein
MYSKRQERERERESKVRGREGEGGTNDLEEEQRGGR